MMPMAPALFLLAAAAAPATEPAQGAYRDVMNAQYAAHGPAIAQRPDEAKRIYDAYLNTLGQKAGTGAERPAKPLENQPR